MCFNVSLARVIDYNYNDQIQNIVHRHSIYIHMLSELLPLTDFIIANCADSYENLYVDTGHIHIHT